MPEEEWLAADAGVAAVPRKPFDHWTYVRRIRRKLEPDPEQPRYVLTEPGVGYRMPVVR